MRTGLSEGSLFNIARSVHSTVHQVSEFTRVTDNFVKVCFVDQNLAVFCCTNIKLTLSKLSNLRLTGCREGNAAAEVQLRMIRLTINRVTVQWGKVKSALLQRRDITFSRIIASHHVTET